jgi:hypothetical protein
MFGETRSVRSGGLMDFVGSLRVGRLGDSLNDTLENGSLMAIIFFLWL